MPWGAVAGAVVGSVANKALSGGSGGGGQTATKDPWSAAVPWLTQNLQSGQNLQNAYAQNPFSLMQQNRYDEQFHNSDDLRNFASSIMGQMNQRRGFDRNNSSARPSPFQMPLPTQRENYWQLDAKGFNPFQSAVMQAAAQGAQAAPVAPAAAPAALPPSYTPGSGSDWWSTRDAAGA